MTLLFRGATGTCSCGTTTLRSTSAAALLVDAATPGLEFQDQPATSSIEALRQQPGDDIKTGFSGSDHGDALSICDMDGIAKRR